MKTALRWLLTVGMVGAGLLHFLRPEPYVAITPEWLPARLVAIFPANVNMAVHAIAPLGGDPLPTWALWGRLPLQLLLVVWAYSYAKRPATPA